MVFFHLKDGVSSDDPQLQEALRAERDLMDAASGGQTWLFGPDVSGRSGSPDYVGVGDFESTDALKDFLAFPAHVRAAELWRPLAAFTVADLQL